MKKLSLFLAFVAFLTVSCKKSQIKPNASESSNGTLSATINGSNYEFNTGTGASIEFSNGNYQLFISGRDLGSSTGLIFNLNSTTPIVAGNLASIGLFQYYAPPSTGFLHIYENNEGTTTPVHITITSITTNTVEGIFDAVLIDPAGHLITITNGKFNIYNVAHTN